MTWMMVLILTIDGLPVYSMPIESELFTNYAMCSYYAIDAKNQMNILLQDKPGYRVTWACSQTKLASQ